MADRDPTPHNAPAARWRRLAPLVLLAGGAAIGAFLLRDTLSFETLRDNREALIALRDANYALAVAAFVAVYVLIVAFSLPGATLASLTGGFLFGLAVGTVLNVGSATVGACAVFLAARWGAGERLSQRIDASDGRARRLAEAIRANEWSVLFLMRLVPVLPFFVANLIPAMLNVRLRVFAVTTFFGIIPGGIVFTWVGVGLGEVFARGEAPDLGLLFEPHVLGPMLGLAALAALPILLRALRPRAVPGERP